MLTGECPVIKRELAGRISPYNDFVALQWIDMTLLGSFDNKQLVSGHNDTQSLWIIIVALQIKPAHTARTRLPETRSKNWAKTGDLGIERNISDFGLLLADFKRHKARWWKAGDRNQNFAFRKQK